LVNQYQAVKLKFLRIEFTGKVYHCKPTRQGTRIGAK
jgi:hypothetical protein